MTDAGEVYKVKAYLDNNATTIIPQNVIDEMVKWTNMGNPSADYCTAIRCRNLIKSFREYIAKMCKFQLSNGEEPDDKINDNHYRVVFTSCASESNSLMIRSVVDSFIHNTKTIPHIVSSKIEHKSILETLEQLEKEGRATVTLISPNPLGFISLVDVEKALVENTALCTIMAANNETGVIMEYEKIANLCHNRGIPFHTDAVQYFARFLIYPVKSAIDAFSVSFHKLHGPIGVGLLVIKEQFLRGYKLKGQIGGTQNNHFRGGTLNISGIAGGYEAMKFTMTNRLKKNEDMRNLKRHIILSISSRMPAKMYREYLLDKIGKPKPEIEVVFLSTAEENYLPNTLLLSVVKRKKPDMCNVKLKKHLCEKGIIVSVGSACNTDSPNASHVLTSMHVDDYIKKGTIRVTLGDDTTIDAANVFIKEFIQYISNLQ